MTIYNQQINVTSGGGDRVAVRSVSSAAHQIVMPAFSDGHIIGSLPRFQLMVSSTAVGADKTMFDFFVGSGSTIISRVLGIYPIPTVETAATGVLGVALHVSRTNSIHTGGTAATSEGVQNVTTFVRMDPRETAISSFFTARINPNSLTDGPALGFGVLFPEETNAAAYWGVNLVREPFICPANSGFKVKQGAVASVGGLRFVTIFELIS